MRHTAQQTDAPGASPPGVVGHPVGDPPDDREVAVGAEPPWPPVEEARQATPSEDLGRHTVSTGPVRHGDLVDMVGGVSRKVVTETLRRLQARGLVSRTAQPGVPPRVDYALTELGRTLIEPIHVLTGWAREHGAAVPDAR